jgi:hypothetical protein
MAGPPSSMPLATLSFAMSAVFVVLWVVMLTRRGVTKFSARNRTGEQSSGHPDPWLEYLLRGAFAEFDRELRKIMPRLYGHEPEDGC